MVFSLSICLVAGSGTGGGGGGGEGRRASGRPESRGRKPRHNPMATEAGADNASYRKCYSAFAFSSTRRMTSSPPAHPLLCDPRVFALPVPPGMQWDPASAAHRRHYSPPAATRGGNGRWHREGAIPTTFLFPATICRGPRDRSRLWKSLSSRLYCEKSLLPFYHTPHLCNLRNLWFAPSQCTGPCQPLRGYRVKRADHRPRAHSERPRHPPGPFGKAFGFRAGAQGV